MLGDAKETKQSGFYSSNLLDTLALASGLCMSVMHFASSKRIMVARQQLLFGRKISGLRLATYLYLSRIIVVSNSSVEITEIETNMRLQFPKKHSTCWTLDVGCELKKAFRFGKRRYASDLLQTKRSQFSSAVLDDVKLKN